MSIRYLQGQTFIGCDYGSDRPDDRNHARGMRPGCGREAVVVMLTEEEIWHAGDVQETLMVATAACAEHAPAEERDWATYLAGDEYVVLRNPLIQTHV